MKVGDILKTAGSIAVKNFVPGGGGVIKLINSLLPDGKKLPDTATGDDALSALDGLDSDNKAKLLEKEYDFKITEVKESGASLRTMLEAEANSKQTTRPKIAIRSFNLVAGVAIASTIFLGYAVVKNNVVMVGALANAWPFIASITAPFVTLLTAYFGILKTEHKNRLDAFNGNPTQGLVSTLINKAKSGS